MKLKISAWVSSPNTGKREEVVITAEEIKEIARAKLHEMYSDEAQVEILDCTTEGPINF